MLHLAAWVACQELSLELGGDEGLLGVLAAGSAVLIAVGDLGCGAVQRKFNFSMLRGRVRGRILNGHPFCLPELGSLHYNVCLSLVVISWLYKQSSHRVHCRARLCDWTKGRSALLLLKERYIMWACYIYISRTGLFVYKLHLDKEVGSSAVQASLMGFSFVFRVQFIPFEGVKHCLSTLFAFICLTGWAEQRAGGRGSWSEASGQAYAGWHLGLWWAWGALCHFTV